MPKKKNYPKWFSPYSKPYPPYKPSEPQTHIISYKKIDEIEYIEYKLLLDFIKMFDEYDKERFVISLESENGYDENTATLVVYEIVKKENKSYNRQVGQHKRAIKKYEEEMKEYKSKIKEWNSLKTKWDNEVATLNEAAERKVLARLKKKYET